MADMLTIGTLAFVSSTDELYIRSLSGWLKIQVSVANYFYVGKLHIYDETVLLTT